MRCNSFPMAFITRVNLFLESVYLYICIFCFCFSRHRCPHRPNLTVGGSDKPCMLTEYATTYHPHPIKLRESFKPQARAVDSDVPIEDKTTHRSVIQSLFALCLAELFSEYPFSERASVSAYFFLFFFLLSKFQCICSRQICMQH